MEELLATKVKPFYLTMMGCSARDADPARLAAVRAASADVTLEQVLRLLADSWRERVMGAWYALAFSPDDVGDALSRSLRTSAGSLTAPPLATAAAVLLGPSAAPAMRAYVADGPADGSPGFVAAALEHVGAEPPVPVRPEDREALGRLLAVARVLRAS